MTHRRSSVLAWMVAFGCAVVVASGPACRAQAEGAQGAPLGAAPGVPPGTKAVHETLIKPRDGVLIVGDDLVLASAWPRMFETGVLLARPNDRIRFSNAGWPGATIAPPMNTADDEQLAPERPQSAALWLQRLLFTVRPTVVVLAFGRSDAMAALEEGLTPGAFEAQFEGRLDAMVTKTLSLQVRSVALLSPPASDAPPRALTPDAPPGADSPAGSVPGAPPPTPSRINDYLRAAHDAALAVAKRRNLVHLDAFTPTMKAAIALRATPDPAVRLSRADATPTAVGSLIVAAAALRDLGVAASDLSRLGWAPAPLDEFRRATPYLPTDIRPDPARAGEAFALAQLIAAYDQHFDLLWRQLEMRLHPLHSKRADILSMHRIEVENDWRAVEEALKAGAAPK